MDLLKIEMTVLFYSPVMRGFLAGYLVASLMYGFIVAGQQRKGIVKNQNN